MARRDPAGAWLVEAAEVPTSRRTTEVRALRWPGRPISVRNMHKKAEPEASQRPMQGFDFGVEDCWCYPLVRRGRLVACRADQTKSTGDGRQYGEVVVLV